MPKANPAPIVTSYLTQLEHVQSLPEVAADAETGDISFGEGAIESFYSVDRRLMRVVATATGAAAQEIVREAAE